MNAPGKPARRLPGVTLPVTLEVGEGKHELSLSLVFDGPCGALRETVYSGRGKIGEGIDLLLQDLSIKQSRAIQGRDPDSGELLPDSWPGSALTAFDPLSADLLRLWAALRSGDYPAALDLFEALSDAAEELDEAPQAIIDEARAIAAAMEMWRARQAKAPPMTMVPFDRETAE